MRNIFIVVALTLAVLAPLAALGASWDSWHRNIEEGQKAAKASGKPLLVITTWKDGV